MGRVASVEHANEAATSLVGWWALAGVDMAVADRPASWLDLPSPRKRPAAAQQQKAPAATPAPKAARKSPEAPAPGGGFDPSSATSLTQLREMVLANRPGAPFADGNPDSGLMLLGDGPSKEDLRTGRPFTGPAGQLLDRMLSAIGLDRQTAYISLIAPRRPVAGPVPAEAVQADLPLTLAHIRLARPRIIILLGAAPAHNLTDEKQPISQLRGRWLDVDAGLGPIPALATFNPAYLLRRPEDKRLAWSDLLALKRRLTL